MPPNSTQTRGVELLQLARDLVREEEARGERFNVFDILQVGHLEVRTHSPILAELLNPQGDHGQKAIFLKLFLRRHRIDQFDADSAKVHREYYIGPVSGDEGGRIDILIRDRYSREILIENKIYANEQENQIGRYLKYSPRGTLIYLTLNGDPPASVSPGMLAQVKRLSYRANIVDWLHDCQNEAALPPRVREIVGQYVQLIQKLTQQNSSSRMNQLLTDAVLKDEESYSAFTALCNAKEEIQRTIWESTLSKLGVVADELGFQLERPTTGISRLSEGFYLKHDMLQTKNLRIGFAFEAGNFYYGFKYLDPSAESPITARLRAEFAAEFGRAETEGSSWATWRWSVEYPQWTDSTLGEMQFGTFVGDFERLFERLKKVTDRACG